MWTMPFAVPCASHARLCPVCMRTTSIQQNPRVLSLATKCRGNPQSRLCLGILLRFLPSLPRRLELADCIAHSGWHAWKP